MNQDGCKTKVRRSKRATGCPENRLLSIESGVRPQRWSPGPQCSSRERKQGVCQKPEQTEKVMRSRTEAHGRRLQKLETGLQTRTVKTRPGSQTEAKHKRVPRSGGKALSRNSETSERAQHAPLSSA
ncbi:hypothetical protein CsSME_00014607 [Camellia sinensis var. sinensis]